MDIIISISCISYNCRTKDLLELQLVVIFISISSADSQLIDSSFRYEITINSSQFSIYKVVVFLPDQQS